MYIHIGEDINIRSKEIIGILDKGSANSSNLVEEFLQFHQKKITNLSKNPFRSVVITDNHIYLSPIASSTLKKRTSQKMFEDY